MNEKVLRRMLTLQGRGFPDFADDQKAVQSHKHHPIITRKLIVRASLGHGHSKHLTGGTKHCIHPTRV